MVVNIQCPREITRISPRAVIASSSIDEEAAITLGPMHVNSVIDQRTTSSLSATYWIRKLRSRFNADFTSDKYDALVRCVNESEKWPADFRISETPIFLTREFTDEVTRAANEIVAATRTPEFVRHSAVAVPKDLEVPNESAHPSFHARRFRNLRPKGSIGFLA